MFERVGKGVVKLKRVRIAFLTDQLTPARCATSTHARWQQIGKRHDRRNRGVRNPWSGGGSQSQESASCVKTQPSIVRPPNPRPESGVRSPTGDFTSWEAVPRTSSQNSRRHPAFPGPDLKVLEQGTSMIDLGPSDPNQGDRKFGPRPQGFGAKGKPFGASPRGPETGSPYRGPRGQGPASGSQKFGSKPQDLAQRVSLSEAALAGQKPGAPIAAPEARVLLLEVRSLAPDLSNWPER